MRVLHRNLLLPGDFLPVEEERLEKRSMEGRKPNTCERHKKKTKQKRGN